MNQKTLDQIRFPRDEDFVRLGRVEMMRGYLVTKDGAPLVFAHPDALELVSGMRRLADAYRCFRLPYTKELLQAYTKQPLIRNSIISEEYGADTEGELTADVIGKDLRTLFRPQFVRRVAGKAVYQKHPKFSMVEVAFEDGCVERTNRFRLPTKISPLCDWESEKHSFFWAGFMGGAEELNQIYVSSIDTGENQHQFGAMAAGVGKGRGGRVRLVRDYSM